MPRSTTEVIAIGGNLDVADTTINNKHQFANNYYLLIWQQLTTSVQAIIIFYYTTHIN